MNKFLWMVRIGGGVYPNEIKESDYYGEGSVSVCVCVCMHACACLHPVQPPHSPPPAHTQYRVDSKASPTMLNCLLYKLSYYRFAESPAYGRPAGYDRVRNAEIGNKDVRLRHVEEAFTSENWIVRIYKVGGGTRALCVCVRACVCAHSHTHTHTPLLIR